MNSQYLHEFFIPCNPPKATAQSGSIIMHRGGRPFIGKKSSSKAAAAQSSLLVLLAAERPKLGTPYAGALEVHVTWTYGWRKSEPKKYRVNGYLPCDTRPDVDNLQKMLFDCMTRVGFWNHDAQLAQVTFKKQWGNTPGIHILIEQAADRKETLV